MEQFRKSKPMPRRFITHVAAIVMVSVLLTSCASGVGSSFGDNGVKVAVKEDMRHCKYLGDIHGLSPFYGIFAAPALEAAREAAMKQAQSLGATHIVWGATDTPYGSTSIHADAYSCK